MPVTITPPRALPRHEDTILLMFAMLLTTTTTSSLVNNELAFVDCDRPTIAR
jgi:hypothetical protein